MWNILLSSSIDVLENLFALSFDSSLSASFWSLVFGFLFFLLNDHMLMLRLWIL